jgi:ubiquinol-cytochrome c reductase cytochrome c subunit
VRRCASFAVVALVALLGACTYGAAETGPFRPAVVAAAGEPAGGKELYQRDCAWCHGSEGWGTPRGPDLVSGTNGRALTHFMLTTGRMPLRYPGQPSKRGDAVYTAAEIDAIVEYVAGLGGAGPDIPELDLGDADVAEGESLYAENCAACHSTTLVGGALTSAPGAWRRSTNAPGLRASTPLEVAEAMLTGPGAMPVFGADAFTDEEIDAIVRYVVTLQKARDRGGLPLLHVGPVTEGAVAWLVGIGSLLIVARWIGTRSWSVK